MGMGQMERIPGMGMGSDRSGCGWAGMDNMGQDGQDCRERDRLGWGRAWTDRIAWMGMGKVGQDCRDGDWH